MNLPPLHKLGGPVCPPCTPTTPTDVSVHELLLLAEERDRLKAESELTLQLQRASLQGGEADADADADADAEPPTLPGADSSIECSICFGSLLKGSGDAPYPPQSLQGGAYGRPYVTVCANGHLFHKECIKRHLANNDRCPECRDDIFRRLDLNLYPKEEQGRVQRDLWKYAEGGQPEVVAYLLAVGGDPNAFMPSDRSAQVVAPIPGRLEPRGLNALMLAARAGHLGVVKALLDDRRTNLRLQAGTMVQRADEIAVQARGFDDPVFKLLQAEGDKVLRGERLPGDQSLPERAPMLAPAAPAQPPEPGVFDLAQRLNEADASDVAAREAANQREELELGPFTHYLVRTAVDDWLTAAEDGLSHFVADGERGGVSNRASLVDDVRDLIRQDMLEHGLDKFEDLDRVQERVEPLLLDEGFDWDDVDFSVRLRDAIDRKIRGSPEFAAAVEVTMWMPETLGLWASDSRYYQSEFALQRVEKSVVEHIMAGALARVARVWYLMGVGRGGGLTTRDLERRLTERTAEIRADRDDPGGSRPAEAPAPPPDRRPPAQPPAIPPQTAADRTRGVRWDGQGTHPLVLSTWRNWWTTEGPGILNAWGLDRDATLHTRMALEMARRLIRNKVENFRDVYDLLYDVAVLEVGIGLLSNDRLPDFVDDMWTGAEGLDEAIYNELRHGVEFRVAVTAARESDPAWRGPIFDWLMDGGLERVVDGFHETGLQRGGTAAARYVWVLNLRATAEELAQRDAAGGVDDFDHSLDHEYLAANHPGR